MNALIVDLGARDNGLAAWFEAEVLSGPSAFWILARDYEDYQRAMTAKLLRELQIPITSGLPDSASEARG